MRILLIASAFNSLTQRVHAELRDRGHTVAHAVVRDGDSVRAAVERHDPKLVIAPLLRTAIPEDVWSRRTCLVVHPGPPGDRGPSSLDWAIQEGQAAWGVTVLQADAVFDAGDVWASASFPMPAAAKSDIYRGEVSDAALEAVMLAVGRFASGAYRPRPQQDLKVRTRPVLDQSRRRIDWKEDSTATVLRTLRAADSRPGVLDELLGEEWYLHGGHPEDQLRGRPGALLATRAQAICRATVDGAVWLPQLRPRRAPGGPATFRLPATLALDDRLPPLPEVPAPLELPAGRRTYSEIRYQEEDGVGFIRFAFPGGAMSTVQCRRLLAAYRFACTRPTRVLVLGGRRDFFSNGIHLGVIEAAGNPAEESMANVKAMDDVVEAVLTTTDRLVVAALPGNAAAGGVMLALAADEVWCRSGTVLNPHYRLMGLPGSEYWTYTLPRRVGAETAESLTRDTQPLSAAAGRRLGLVDHILPSTPQAFAAQVAARAAELAGDPGTHQRVTDKKKARARDEAIKPLAAYRTEELAAMRRVCHDPAAPYHALRRAFLRKEPPPGARRVRPAVAPSGGHDGQTTTL
ncbi:hydrogenase maturation factor HoxX [Streptomyces sulfonofaciens]|uniref:Hydrogenase maturation factor HoxX n=1 Tax=Streptomyces sulfonofaciens TaxID=68272 RepID=A0A919GLM5_9ACTN|nr:hydrogenase maturation protein [Streptomyces sulfonofaciens]GHH86798.1 hydrogenase maturation factor HoxX [Streptomyces sulfonofaciens]